MSNPYLFCQGQMAVKCGGVTRAKEKNNKKKRKKVRCDEWMKGKCCRAPWAKSLQSVFSACVS